ncbi:hypothetical protein TIFTF001_021544 [Ficus carica]|uniref:Uncharacterized protein n=1 Tax=Ficus carica TaxID=3494 RepID=A0AA88AAN7_FICCA|nr:hypothetical protein TIFTF001_021544 [Ficus carica]
MDSEPPQAVEDRGGASPDVYGLPCSVTRHTAGRGGGSAAAERVAREWRLLDRTLLGSARSCCCRLGLSRRARSLPRPPVGEGLRGRLPDLGGLLGVDSATSGGCSGSRTTLVFRWLSTSVITSSVRSLTFPTRITEPDRHSRNPDYLAQPWLVVELFGSVPGVLSGPGCSGRLGRVGCLGYPVDR